MFVHDKLQHDYVFVYVCTFIDANEGAAIWMHTQTHSDPDEHFQSQSDSIVLFVFYGFTSTNLPANVLLYVHTLQRGRIYGVVYLAHVPYVSVL